MSLTNNQNKQDEVISLILNIINIELSANFEHFLHDFVYRLIDRNANFTHFFHLAKFKIHYLREERRFYLFQKQKKK